MGLTIASYPMFGGAATVSNVYCNVRDLRQNKIFDSNNEASYEIAYIVHYLVGQQRLESKYYQWSVADPSVDMWLDCYTHLKNQLTAANIAHTDD